MEHRLYVRNLLQKPIIVDCRRFNGGVVTTRDISPGGIFVESPLLFFLPMYTPLTLKFSLRSSVSRDHEFRPDAIVVRHTSVGTALMFLEMEIEDFRALYTALCEIAESERSPGKPVPRGMVATLGFPTSFLER